MNERWQPFRPSSDRPWNQRLAAHLLRRAGFGGSFEEIDNAVSQGLEKTVDRLFDLEPASDFNNEMKAAGKVLSTTEDSKPLSSWWLLRMVQTPCPLLEKMTLFWHGHFATGGEKVLNARAMLNQNNLLRENALGKFENMVQGISKDPAMLTYLDSTENRKTRPNENYARELLELFCLGPGNYTEADIKEIARCFTGWEIRKSRFRFNAYQHDKGSKSFFGESGTLGGEQAVRIVLNHSAAPRFIAGKLIRFFVSDLIELSDELVQPLAHHLRKTDFDIASAVRMIVTSNLFYSDESVGAKIKSPVELGIGTLRFFNATCNMSQIMTRMERLGQLPLYPPNVKGWDGGTNWINASTIIARANLVTELIANGQARFEQGDLKSWFQRRGRKLIDDIDEYLLASPLAQSSKKVLADLGPREPEKVIATLASLPEFQMN